MGIREKQVKLKKPVQKGVCKVPVIMQMEALECGAACLAMILAYYGKWIPLEQVRFDCGVSRDGTNARSILKAARRYDMQAAGYRYEAEELRKQGRFPCIIHWNLNHFVVLNGFQGNQAIINDPARGLLKVPMKQFTAAFTGVCLQLEPGDAFIPEGKQSSMLHYARKRLKGAEAAVVFVVLTTVITSLISVINPAFSRIFLDRLLTGENPEWLLPFLLFMTAFALLQLIAAWIEAVYSLRISGKIDVVGSTSFMWHVLRLPMDFFSQRMAGDIQQRQASHACIAGELVDTFAPLVLHAAMMIFYFAVMLRYSVMLTMIGILSIGINLLVSNLISRKRINLTRVQLRDRDKLAGTTVSGIELIETIKASGAENGFFEKWAGYQASVNAQQVQLTKLNHALGMIPALVNSLTNTAILMLGVYLTMAGSFTAGMIMAFQGFLSSLLSPAMTLIAAGQTLQEMRTEMERVEDVMSYPTDEVYAQEAITEQAEYAKLSGCIELRQVSFGYNRLGEPLIEQFNLSMKTGSRVAFVGSSGCGKSTLAKLIAGLYKPWSGEILFDGKPIAAIDRSVFTGSVAVVDQDIILFEDTIANNIKMWDSTIEDYEMILAARDAQLHEDIMQRDGGYQYTLTEGGKDFSGGQRQRMEIARVLAQDPTILILDEATSALDAKTEAEVVQSIKDRGITCIVIAHRLSTVRDCDEIIVMEHGKIAERGTHEELYAKGGVYTRLLENE